MYLPGKNFIGTTVFALIFDKNGRILLALNKKYSKLYHSYKNRWCMIGGKIKFGETIIEALKREVKEESSLIINNIKFINYNEHIENGWHWIALNFKANTKNNQFKNREKSITKELRWFKTKDVPTNISHYTKKCLKDLKIKIGS